MLKAAADCKDNIGTVFDALAKQLGWGCFTRRDSGDPDYVKYCGDKIGFDYRSALTDILSGRERYVTNESDKDIAEQKAFFDRVKSNVAADIRTEWSRDDLISVKKALFEEFMQKPFSEMKRNPSDLKTAVKALSETVKAEY